MNQPTADAMTDSPYNTTLDTVVTRSPDLLMAEVGGETVLMSVDQGNYYGLAETARKIWLHLEAPIKVADLICALRAAYSGDPARIEAETLAFLNHMNEKGLVHRV